MKILKLAVILLLFAMNVHGGQFFVSTNGDDSNPGTKEKPFATLTAARDALRQYRLEYPWKVEEHVIYIREGIYALDKKFELNQADSGLEKERVIFRSWQGENVRIIGGQAIPAKAFEKVTDVDTLGKLSPEAGEHVVQVNLKQLGINDFGQHKQYGHALPVVTAPLELLFNGQTMQLARYPNSGYIKIHKVIDPGSLPRRGDYSNRGGIFEYKDERHSKWAGVDDIWLQGTFKNGYADDKIKIEKIDPEKKQIKLASPHMYSIGAGRPYQHYYALNILSEIDMPGEWYVDRETGVLYFWPPDKMNGAEILVSMLEDPVISFRDAAFITLENITVECARGIGIYIEGGCNINIKGCTVRNVGTSGIFMGQGARQTIPYITHDDYEGVPISERVGNLQGHIYKYTTWDRKAGTDHLVQSCDVYNTGSGGIYLSGGSKKELVPGGSAVVNCKVHNYNRRNRFLWSGVNIDGCGNRIANCEIFNSDFQAVYAHGNEHLYEYNYFHDIAQNSDDTSAWYLGRDPGDRGNVIRYNLFHNVGRPDRSVMGIYCDDATTDVTVYGNVFYNVAKGRAAVFSNAGHDLTIQNNIFVECGSAVEISSFWYTWAARPHPIYGNLRKHYFEPEGLYRTRLLDRVDITEKPYSSKYPGLVDWLDPIAGTDDEFVGMRPRRNVMKNNIVIKSKEEIMLRGPYAQCETINNDISENGDENITLSEASPVLQINPKLYRKVQGFEPIPVEKIGLYSDQYRKVPD